MTAQQLSERCRQLGAPIHRSTITKIENGRPRFDLGELIVLASALVTSPVVLVYPGPYNEEIDGLPTHRESQFEMAQWFSALADDDGIRLDAIGIRELQEARGLVERVSLRRENFEEVIERLHELERRITAGEAEQARFIEEQRRSADDA